MSVILLNSGILLRLIPIVKFVRDTKINTFVLVSLTSLIVMAALRSRCGHYILALWFLSSIFFLFLA